MEEERTVFRKFKDYFSIIFAFALVGLGLYTYRFYIRDNPLSSLILFTTSTLSMIFIFGIWRKFTEKYAPDIIYWTTQQKWLRKAVAGGSFSYYEYKENIYKIGLLEPISRFMSMMIAFIGIASSLANTFGLKAVSPVSNPTVALAWAGLIVVIPIILTPIVPIIWAMEDLQLKSWNDKYKTNIRISRIYKRRFNSFIAIGTLGIAFSLSRDPNLALFVNFMNFLTLLQVGVIVLTYPIAVLTLLYYLYFRGTVIDKIRNRMNIPIAETRLIYRNTEGQILDSEGNIIAEKPASEKDVVNVVATTTSDQVKVTDDMENEEDKNLPQKIGSTAKTAVTKTGDAVVGTGKAVVDGITNVGKSIKDNTIGRLFGKEKSDEEEKPATQKSNQSKDLRDDKQPKYKYSGGSATAGLWDDEKKKKKD